MAELWTAFLEDYGNEIRDWTPRQLLELFWYYCQDGSKAVQEFLSRKVLAKRCKGCGGLTINDYTCNCDRNISEDTPYPPPAIW